MSNNEPEQISTEEMEAKYGPNWDSRPHSNLCDCDECGNWCHDFKIWEDSPEDRKEFLK